jgi:hypothetical protein
MKTHAELLEMLNTTDNLVKKLLFLNERRLAMRVLWLNSQIVLHELHRIRTARRSEKLREKHAQLTIDLYVKDFSMDLEELL